MREIKQLLALGTLLVLIAISWQQLFFLPLRLLVVFFHESSHAVATLLTGGEVVELAIDPREGGYVLSRGGNQLLIISAGYLGSLLWGVVIFLFACISRWDHIAVFLLGITIAAITVAFSRDFFRSVLAFCSGLHSL